MKHLSVLKLGGELIENEQRLKAMGRAIKTPLANGMAELTRPRDWRIGRATKPIPASRWTPPWNDRANASPAPRS